MRAKYCCFLHTHKLLSGIQTTRGLLKLRPLQDVRSSRVIHVLTGQNVENKHFIGHRDHPNKRHLSQSNTLRCQAAVKDSDASEVVRKPTRRPHIPVMVEEVIDCLKPCNGQTIIDMTFGAGGHTRAILEQAPSCRVFGLDRDPIAHEIGLKLMDENPHFRPMLGRFSEVHFVGAPHGLTRASVDAVLFDVGASSMQFDEALRGFSLSQNGPLDMRMDYNRDSGVPTAGDLVNRLDENSLYLILKKYGEERKARLISRAIVDARYTFGRIKTTKQLADIVSAVYNNSHGYDKLQRHAHPATKTFQALRIFVNNELNELNNGLELAYQLLKPGGVCVVISFHSLEDRIAKRHFHGIDMDERANLSLTAQSRSNRVAWREEEETNRMLRRRWEPISRKVMVTSRAEEERNPRARSAKLRAAYRVESHT